MERRGHPRIPIKTAMDYNMVCDDIISEWLEDFTEREGLTRPVEEGDFADDRFSFMYTNWGMYLYDTFCRRLTNLGMKYFDEEDLDIKSSNVIYP